MFRLPGTPGPRPAGGTGRVSLAFDLSLAVSVTTLDLVLTVSVWRLDTAYSWVVLVFQTLAGLALVARRHFPRAVLVALGVAGLAQFVPLLVAPGWMWPAYADGVWVVTPLSTPFAAYAVVVYGRRRATDLALIAMLTLIATRPWHLYVAVVAVGLNLTIIPALLGATVAARRRLILALSERAERAERERHLLAAQARADERTRLAREMHDVVTHRVSLMVLQAGALRVTTSDPRVRAAAEELRQSGCTALEELRELIGVLRAGPSTPTPPGGAPEGGAPPGAGPVGGAEPLPDLTDLVARSRALGGTVDHAESGDPLWATAPVGRTAYRVVQEALTNAAKHAPGAPVGVEVRHAADQIHLTVTNGAARQPTAPELTGTGSGWGLLGLRQRVDLVGGTLEAGPLPEGGFRVEARLPGLPPALSGVRDDPATSVGGAALREGAA